MRAVQYIFLNKGAGMSTGKSAAQAGHAAVEAYRQSESQAKSGNQTSAAALRAWRLGDHYTKIVLEANDAEQLVNIERYLRDRRFSTALIIDEGHTEVEPFTPTALGIEILDKEHPHVAATFGEFKLYKDEQPQGRKSFWRWLRDSNKALYGG